MNRPEISTIVTTYQDKPQELKDSIISILHQENVNIELIISMVSDDQNLDMIREWIPLINESKFTRAKLVIMEISLHPGRSPGGSFAQINEALGHVTKPWIRWFSGDDILYPGSSFKQVQALERSGKLVSYGGFTLLNDLGEPIDSVKCYPYSRDMHHVTNFINDVALWSSDLLKFAPFNWERWENYSFWDFWIRVHDDLGDVFDYYDAVLWAYRIRDRSEHIARVKRPGGKQTYDRERRAFLKNHRRVNR